MLQPFGIGNEDRLSEVGRIRSAEKLIRVHHKHIWKHLSDALAAPASRLHASFSGLWKLLTHSQRLIDREPTARHAAPFVAETAERLGWDEVSQYHNDGYLSLADQVCRELAIQHHAGILRNPCEQKISRIQTAYRNISRRMTEVYEELILSEEFSPTDGSENAGIGPVVSEMMLITMDKIPWSAVYPRPDRGLIETERDMFKRTLLHLACEDPLFTSFDHFDSCSLEFIEARDKYRMTAVHVAASYGNVGGLTKLRFLKADMTMLDFLGRSPLMLASEKGHTKIVDLLLKYGCDIDAVSVKQPRALVCAIRAGATSTVHLLLKSGAFLFHESDERGTLEEAELNGNEIIADLIQHRISLFTKFLETSHESESIPDARPLQQSSFGTDENDPISAGASAPGPALNAQSGAGVSVARTSANPAISTRLQPRSHTGAPVFTADSSNKESIGWHSQLSSNGSRGPGAITGFGVPAANNDLEEASWPTSSQTTQEQHDDASIAHLAGFSQSPHSSYHNAVHEGLDEWSNLWWNVEPQPPDPP